jgi:hypothetical protein
MFQFSKESINSSAAFDADVTQLGSFRLPVYTQQNKRLKYESKLGYSTLFCVWDFVVEKCCGLFIWWFIFSTK